MNQEECVKIMTINHNYINDELMKRIKTYLVASWLKYALAIGVVIELLLGVYAFLHYHIFYTIFFVLLAIIIGGYYPILLNITVNKSFLQKMSFLGKHTFEYQLIFDEEKIIYISKDTQINVKYAHLKKCIQTSQEYIFITQSGKYIVCQKKNMTDKDIKQLEDLTKKCKHIKR